MIKYNLILISFLLVQVLKAQNPTDFYFTIVSPSNIYQSLAPGAYGSVGTGWGWDGTIPNDFFAEMVYPSEDMDENYLCDGTPTDYSGKVVLVTRGLCDFSQKALNAQNQGAIAVVIRNFDENLIHMAPGEFGADVTIPCINITESVGDQLIFELMSGSTVIVAFSNTPNPILQISGTVIRDENEDCMTTSGEPFLQGWKIFTQGSNGFSRINYSDANGQYRLFVDTGTYEVNLIAPGALWQACPPVTISSGNYDSVTIDLHAQVLDHCPMMSIDIEIPLLRRCFDNNTFTVNYCNHGTTLAQSAYATVQFDELISVENASLPYTALANNSYEFLLGDVESNECGSFTITTLVSCEAELSQTLCAFASVYPQVNCEQGGGSYTGPSLKVTGDCNASGVTFQIENVGVGDMIAPTDYTVYRNAFILSNGSVQLMSGKSSDYQFTADGATYRLEANQAAGHPGESSPSYTVEACTNGTGDFVTGFFNMFSPADYGEAYDEACLMVIGSYDPNDKSPTPLGYGNEHFIERNTDIHYLIRFQNTGTDTAFNISVRDTLSGLLDISSLKLGVSSHEYTFSLSGNNGMDFRFKNIMLPDSNINEAASHGFLTYTIKQNPGLATGSVIRNAASIYFDFNDPIITNETFHTIGEHFIGITGIATLDRNISLQVYPNPMKEYVLFHIQDVVFQKGYLELYNVSGQLVRVEKFREPSFEVKRNGLKTGAYFYKLTLDDKLSATGLIQVLGSSE